MDLTPIYNEVLKALGYGEYEMQFICNECKSDNHEACVERDKDKLYSDCDCGHKVGDK